MVLPTNIRITHTIICCLCLFFVFPNFVFAKDFNPDNLNEQAYKYTVSVIVPKPDLFLIFPLNKLARTTIRVNIPLDWVGTEQYINTVNPKADVLDIGPGWAQNQHLVFLLPADSEQSIHISGIVNNTALNIDQLAPVRDAYKNLTMDKLKKFKLYIQPTRLIESDNPKIIETAKKIRGDKNRFEDVVTATYNFVINRIDYDMITIDLRKNGTYVKPQSAIETLEKGSGVCVDYSRLLIALLRAQGIPARMVTGAVNIQRQNGEQMPLHAWVQIFVPDVAFIDIDPTWGEGGSKYISDIDTDHIRLHFSLPNDPEDDEGSNVYKAFTLNNYLPFLIRFWHKSDAFVYTTDFTPIDKIEGLENMTKVGAIAPITYSQDKGYINPFVDIVRFKSYQVVTDPLVLFLFQTFFLFPVTMILLFGTIKKKMRRKSRR